MVSQRRDGCCVVLSILLGITIQGTVCKASDDRGGVCMASDDSGILSSVFTAEVRPILDAVDRISLMLSNEKGGHYYGIDLPDIVVVGDQNSGKFSVLESLSGVALPRSEGLTTRAPLTLRLRRAANTSAHLSYLNQSSRHQVNLLLPEVPSKITQITEALAGTKSGMFEGDITLDIAKPDAPDLTMVDLPGLVTSPAGDQPKDIEYRIRIDKK